MSGFSARRREEINKHRKLVEQVCEGKKGWPEPNEPLTPEGVARAEKHWGVRLPAAYLALLEVFNGLYQRPELEDYIDGVRADGKNSIDERDWDELAQWMDGDAKRPKKHKLLVPFSGDGHAWHCFDYRKCGPEGEPSVTHIDLELAEPGERPPETKVEQSFEKFLKKSILKERRARLKREAQQTPLHLAQSAAEVQELVAAGGQVNALNGEGQSPLFRAIWDKRNEVALALLDAGADPRVGKVPLNITCLFIAHHASPAVLERMLQAARFDDDDLTLAEENYSEDRDEERLEILRRWARRE